MLRSWSLLVAFVTLFSILGFLAPMAVHYRLALKPAHLHEQYGLPLFSCFFLHSNAWHLLANLFWLIPLARLVELKSGANRLWSLFLIGGFVGAVTYSLMYRHATRPATGASAAVAALLGYTLAVRKQFDSPRSRRTVDVLFIAACLMVSMPLFLYEESMTISDFGRRQMPHLSALIIGWGVGKWPR